MKVTIVAPFYPYREAAGGGAYCGGVETALAQLAHELSVLGANVTILTTARSSHVRNVGKVTVRAVKRLGVVFRNPVAFIVPSLLGIRSDVVHVSATYPGFSEQALLVARMRRTRGILDLHFEPVFGGVLSKALAHTYMSTGARLFRYYDRVLVHSPGYATECVSLRGMEPGKLTCIPYGVDCDAFQPAFSDEKSPSRDQHSPSVLFVGRLVPYKGVDVLLDAWTRVVSSLPGARLIVAGSGPLEAPLRKRAQLLGANIIFLGYVSDDKLRSLYRSTDVTVLPSVNRQEAFGMTLLESMACGTPVVASGIPGVRDIALIGGKTAPPGNPERLAAAIVEVVRDLQLPRGWALHERVRERFAWPNIAMQHLTVYESILHSRF